MTRTLHVTILRMTPAGRWRDQTDWRIDYTRSDRAEPHQTRVAATAPALAVNQHAATLAEITRRPVVVHYR